MRRLAEIELLSFQQERSTVANQALWTERGSSMRQVSCYLVQVLACLSVVPAIAGDLEPPEGSQSEGTRLVAKFVLPRYHELPVPVDPVSIKHPHLLSVEVRDLLKVTACDGWIAQIWVPTRREPPYVGGNHHNEYWGVTKKSQYRLGEGDYFELNQNIELAALSEFVAAACGRRLESEIADVYVRLTLAGRFPFASAEAPTPRCWHWLTDLRELPDDWAEDLDLESRIPPGRNPTPTGSAYRGCVIARVGWEHTDLACWEFEFNSTRSSMNISETLRRQSKPSFPSDSIMPNRGSDQSQK